MSLFSSRRTLLKRLGAVGLGAGVTSFAGFPVKESLAASGNEYKALICVFLNGGVDGNDILVPVDASYQDYSKARPSLAIAKDSLITLSGGSGGRTLGVPTMAKELATLYEQGRLSMIANVGALVKPVTAAQVVARTANVPPFLFSHSEQSAYIQGWMGDVDASGWAGRAMERIPTDLRDRLPVISYSMDNTLLLGKQSRVTQTSPNWGQYWGAADLSNTKNPLNGVIESMGLMQSRNVFEAEYARTLGATFRDAVAMSTLGKLAKPPANTYPKNDLADSLRHIAGLMPVFKAAGIKRQVFLVSFGAFDTHVKQRGTGEFSLDTQIASAVQALAAFDQSVQAAGLDQNVVTLSFSEFGRALQPASGGGTDHAWGNHWWLMGGPVRGKQIVGTYPSLALGGVDDGDQWKKGRWVPTIAGDQVGASLMQWLGVPASELLSAFPSLSNFSQKTLPLLYT